MAADPQTQPNEADFVAMKNRLETLRTRFQSQMGRTSDASRSCQPDLEVRLWAIGEGLRQGDRAADLHGKIQDGLRETEDLIDKCGKGHNPFADLRGMVVRGVQIPGQDHPMPYGAHIPAAYDPGKGWPLFIYVHGGGASEQARFAIARFRDSAPASQPATRPDAASARPIDQMLKIWVPRTGGSWADPANEDRVFAAIADMKAHYNVARDRVYIQGFSLGGFGAVHFAVRFPDMWAGAGPSSPTPVDGYMPLAENLSNLPMFLCHGSIDDVCDVRNSRQLFDRLRELHFDAVYREDTRLAHQSTDLARAAQEAWLLTKARNPSPDKVVYLTDNPRYHRAYWVDITRLEPMGGHGPARIEATRGTAGEFQVRTRGILTFAILLDDATAPIGRPVSVFLNDGPAKTYPWPEDGRLVLDVAASDG